MLTISNRPPCLRLSSNRKSSASCPTPPGPTDSLELSGAVRSSWANPFNLLQQLESPDGSGLWHHADRILQTQDAAGGWGEGQAAAPDADSSVLHHVALTALLRRQEHCKLYPDRYTKEQRAQLTPSPEQRDRLQKALEKSWNHLSPKTSLKGERALEALPSRALSSVHQAAALVHEAFLGDRLQTRIEPKKTVQEALTYLERGIGGEALEPQTHAPATSKAALIAGAAAAALGAGLLLTGAGLAQVLAGLASGWMVASMAESVVHDKVAHCHDLPGTRPTNSNPSVVGWAAAHGPEWLSQKLENSWFGHTKIHHYRTFTKDHVSQFRDAEDQKKIDQYLVKHGRTDLIEEEYGNTIRPKGYAMFQAVASPAYALALGAATLLGAGPLFALGFAAPVAAYPLFSKEFHRYSHMPAKEALSKASAPMAAFLKTPMSRFIVRHHFMHHVDDKTNFNLMPGADFLRGKAVKPGVAHQEELRRLGVLY